MHEIVVPLDGSGLAERAALVAGGIADETGASVRLVRVATAPGSDAALAHLRSVANTLLDGVDVAVEVIEAPSEAIVADSLLEALGDDRPDLLLCMSTHGRSGLGSVLLGSTAEAILHRRRQPSLLVGRRCAFPWPDRRRGLLLPIDGVHLDDRIVEALPEVVGSSRLDPILLKVTHSFDVEGAHHPMTGLDEAADRLAGMGIEAKRVHRFASNLPVAIAEVVDEHAVALMAMTTYVHPGAQRALLGSTTMRAVRQVTCPALVFPTDTPDASEVP